MPLIKSKSQPAFVKNLKAELKAGKPRAQSLAIAYAMKRRARASGGPVFEGPIVSSVPGRTDHLAADVGQNSYVIPAETVSHLGQSNTLAGLKKLEGMFGRNSKYGRGLATGGSPSAPGVPVNLAGGEYVISPEIVARIGGGDPKKGHAWLDKWVMSQRKKHIKTLRNLAGPAHD